MRPFRKRPPGWGFDYEIEAYPGGTPPKPRGSARTETLLLFAAGIAALAFFGVLAWILVGFEETKGGLPDDYFRQRHLEAWELEQQTAAEEAAQR